MSHVQSHWPCLIPAPCSCLWSVDRFPEMCNSTLDEKRRIRTGPLASGLCKGMPLLDSDLATIYTEIMHNIKNKGRYVLENLSTDKWCAKFMAKM